MSGTLLQSLDKELDEKVGQTLFGDVYIHQTYFTDGQMNRQIDELVKRSDQGDQPCRGMGTLSQA